MGKRCLQSRPRGPAPKISPARKGWVHRQAIERRRCGTTLFVCSLGPERSGVESPAPACRGICRSPSIPHRFCRYQIGPGLPNNRHVY
jgi:hypothetical protein